MLEANSIETPFDAEREFRHRLAAKLAARGYDGTALQDKINELLRTGVKFRLNIEQILSGP